MNKIELVDCKEYAEDWAVCYDCGEPKGQCQNCGYKWYEHRTEFLPKCEVKSAKFIQDARGIRICNNV